ncbi:hypothetical protein D3C85_523250 [compost metagenome]
MTHLAPQLLLERMRVVGDQHVGALEDAAGGAVVLLEHHHLEAGEVVLEQHEVFRPRAAPGVNRLVVVADHGELRALGHQQLDQQVLAGVGVLVFVDQHVAHLVAPLLQHLGVVLEQLDRLQDQVVEVDRVVGLEGALVVQVDDGGGLLARVARLLQCLLGEDQVVLPGADQVLDLVDAVVALVLLLHDVGEQRLDVLLVEDREARLVAEVGVLLADDVEAEVVEGRHRQALALAAAQQAGDALLHLARGLVGEGHRDDVLRADAALLDQVGDLAGDHAGLAGSGAGQHQQRAADVVDGFLLAGIESGHAGRGVWLRRRRQFSRLARSLNGWVTGGKPQRTTCRKCMCCSYWSRMSSITSSRDQPITS